MFNRRGKKLNLQKPDWIRAKVSCGTKTQEIKKLLRDFNLSTVCDEASCPNKAECWNRGHVTFMILGEVCTRNCLFCNVTKGKPSSIDPDEPEKISRAVKKIGAKYIVITSTTRDDLPDGGSSHFLRVVENIKKVNPKVQVELLIPDFDGNKTSLEKVASSGAEVIGHNIEMPERLYSTLRTKSGYNKSLKVLKDLSGLKLSGLKVEVKSSMMIGLGESFNEIKSTLIDLKENGTEIVYIGQYLSPTKTHWPVEKYYTISEFKNLENFAKEIGFQLVKAGPLVRSSYLL